MQEISHQETKYNAHHKRVLSEINEHRNKETNHTEKAEFNVIEKRN